MDEYDDNGAAKCLALMMLMLFGGLAGGIIGEVINYLFIKGSRIVPVAIGVIAGLFLSVIVGVCRMWSND